MKIRSIISSIVVIGAMFSINAYAFNIKDSLKNMVIGKQQQGQYAKQQGSGSIYDRIGIEATQEWQDMYLFAKLGFNRVDQEIIRLQTNNNVCSRASLEQLNQDPVYYEYNLNVNLPKFQSPSSKIFDVNTYRKLNELHYNRNDGLEAVYMPNVLDIKSLMSRPNNSFNQNNSAIMLPTIVVQQARQQFNNQGRRPEVDLQNLREAMLRDVTTYAYIFAKNPQLGYNVESFMKSAFLLYMRNKVNCEFDVYAPQQQYQQIQQPQMIQPLSQGYYVPPQQQQQYQPQRYEDQDVRMQQQYESR